MYFDQVDILCYYESIDPRIDNPGKHITLAKFQINAGPPSAALAQHLTDIGLAPCV